MHLLIQKDKVKAFIKLWSYENRLCKKKKNKIDMFPRLNLCAQDNIETNKISVEHLNGLLLQFSNSVIQFSVILVLQSLRGYRIHLSTKKIMNLN